MLDGHGPFREDSSLGPKVGPSIAPLNLNPSSLKNFISTLHEPTSSPCMVLENGGYGKSPPTPTYVFFRTPLLEEFVCLGGFSLLESIEFQQSLAIFPTGTNLLT